MLSIGRRLLCLLPVALLAARCVFAADGAYDPLAVAKKGTAEFRDFTVHDEARKREIPIRVYLPPEKKAAPVVVFSHGLGGGREHYVYLGSHWAARGYVAVVVQHPGSDTSVWRDKPKEQRMAAMRQAASLQNFLLRNKDVSVVLDQLERWNAPGAHPLAGRLDLKHVGMSGHSFGAVTTQAVSGQSFARGAFNYTDSRIKAAIPMSPSVPRKGADLKQTFGSVKIPWMLMTGTLDTAPIGDIDVPARLAVFPALPPGGKYELVLNRAEHSVFSDRALPGDKEKRNPHHQRAVLALSTAFWDAYLRNDSAAKAWLDGDGPKSVLEKDDRWQKK